MGGAICARRGRGPTSSALRATPLIGLDGQPVGVAADLLEAAMRRVFEPTEQIVGVLVEILSLARGHAHLTYPDMPSFRAGIHLRHPPLQASGTLLLVTGLAGVGKSAVLAALERILDIPGPLRVPSVGTVALVLRWSQQIGERTSIASILQALSRQAWEAADVATGVPEDRRTTEAPPKSVMELVRSLRARGFRDGVSLLSFDEFQFLTRSRDANALVTSLLFHLLSLGLPCVWAANYGLGHRLLRRPQEDLDRLFAREPLILFPDEPDSDDWQRTIAALIAVAPAAFDIDIIASAEELHEMTAGLRRYLRALLIEGYRVSRSGHGPVGMNSLREAYKRRYAIKRRVVGFLRQIDCGVPPNRAQQHLVCPFDVPVERIARRKEKATADRTREAFRKLAHSQLTQDERAAHLALQTAAQKKGGSSSVTSIRGKRKTSQSLSLETLLAAESQRKTDK